jgi:hypothetical protein
MLHDLLMNKEAMMRIISLIVILAVFFLRNFTGVAVDLSAVRQDQAAESHEV